MQILASQNLHLHRVLTGARDDGVGVRHRSVGYQRIAWRTIGELPACFVRAYRIALTYLNVLRQRRCARTWEIEL
jgi:hypothetical protein